MAVEFDASQEDAGALTNTATYSHTCSGENRYLFVSLTVDRSTDQDASATYGGVNMTRIANLSAQQYLACFELVNPPSGANDIVLNWTDTEGRSSVSQSYKGVDQSNPSGTPVTSESATGTSVSNNVSSKSDDLVIDGVAVNNQTEAQVTEGAGQNLRNEISSGAGGTLAAGSDEQGAATVTMSWSWISSGRNAHCAVNLNASPVTWVDGLYG